MYNLSKRFCRCNSTKQQSLQSSQLDVLLVSYNKEIKPGILLHLGNSFMPLFSSHKIYDDPPSLPFKASIYLGGIMSRDSSLPLFSFDLKDMRILFICKLHFCVLFIPCPSSCENFKSYVVVCALLIMHLLILICRETFQQSYYY